MLVGLPADVRGGLARGLHHVLLPRRPAPSSPSHCFSWDDRGAVVRRPVKRLLPRVADRVRQGLRPPWGLSASPASHLSWPVYIPPMDSSIYFSEQHLQVREMVRDFSRAEIAPVARELDQTSTFPWENVRKMGELGLLGVPWGEELGGSGMDQLSYYITIHEMAKVDASHALTISAHTNLGTSPIVEFGTAEQRERYVPLLASGRVLGGFGLTEPGAGSDAGGTASTAEDRGDHYLLNGSKIFITHAGVGEIFSVTARTASGGGHRNITSFIVTKDTVDLDVAKQLGVGHAPDLPKTKGVRAGKKEEKMGWRASDTRELILEDAIVPKENVLGEPGRGFVNFLKTLDAGRIGIAALSLGIAEGAYDQALAYA